MRMAINIQFDDRTSLLWILFPLKYYLHYLVSCIFLQLRRIQRYLSEFSALKPRRPLQFHFLFPMSEIRLKPYRYPIGLALTQHRQMNFLPHIYDLFVFDFLNVQTDEFDNLTDDERWINDPDDWLMRYPLLH